MQSDRKIRLSDLCERDREAFLTKMKYHMATSIDIAFWAAQEECPESEWKQYALNEDEEIRNGLACNPKITLGYLRSLVFSAEGQEVEWLQNLIKFREAMEALPDLDEKGRPVLKIRLV